MLKILVLCSLLMCCCAESDFFGTISNQIWNLPTLAAFYIRQFFGLLPFGFHKDYCFGRHQHGFGGIFNTLGVLPMDPVQMDVQFRLYTCQNRDKAHILNYKSSAKDWIAAGYKAHLRTRMIIHGWMQQWPGSLAGVYNNQLEQMKDLFLNKKCINVIVVDWHIPGRAITYIHSAANTPIVGKLVGCVINKLKYDLGADVNKFHLIGHSLGSHVAGMAAKQVKDPQIGHLLATDPAGPSFIGAPPTLRLTENDAQIVNVIHSDGTSGHKIAGADGFGYLDRIGTTDFYINRGLQQPGCPWINETLKMSGVNLLFMLSPWAMHTETLGMLTCNHERSNYYALATPKHNDTLCQPIAYKCNSYEDFMLGMCNDCDKNHCVPMEFDIDFWDDTQHWHRDNAKYFINSRDVFGPDFCLYHYQFVLVSKVGSTCDGNITIQVSGGDNLNVSLSTYNQIKVPDAGPGYTALYTTPVPVTKETTAVINGVLDVNCNVKELQFRYMSNLNKRIRIENSVRMYSTNRRQFCPKGGNCKNDDPFASK